MTSVMNLLTLTIFLFNVMPSPNIIPKVCIVCSSTFMTNQTDEKRRQVKTCSRPCRNIAHKLGARSGEKHHAWKGNDVGYYALHDWVRRKLGTPSLCEFCGTTEGSFDWSSISRTYKRDLSDWQRLCKSCHSVYDERPDKWRETMVKRYGSTNTRTASNTMGIQ